MAINVNSFKIWKDFQRVKCVYWLNSIYIYAMQCAIMDLWKSSKFLDILFDEKPLIQGPELQQALTAGRRDPPVSDWPHGPQGLDCQRSVVLSSLLSHVAGQQQQDNLHWSFPQILETFGNSVSHHGYHGYHGFGVGNCWTDGIFLQESTL